MVIDEVCIGNLNQRVNNIIKSHATQNMLKTHYAEGHLNDDQLPDHFPPKTVGYEI